MTLPIVVMGVSGSGKTTLGSRLALALHRPFIEGDALHSPENLAKMARGEPLTDEDRAPFLEDVAKHLVQAPEPAIASCSALKRAYRDRLRTVVGDILFIMPIVNRDELRLRMATRTRHFMPPAQLDDQLATLERPTPDERAMFVSGALDIEDQLAQLMSALTSVR